MTVLRWFLSPTGLVVSSGFVALGVALAFDLAIVGLIGLAIVILGFARVTDVEARRAAVLRSDLSGMGERVRALELALDQAMAAQRADLRASEKQIGSRVDELSTELHARREVVRSDLDALKTHVDDRDHATTSALDAVRERVTTAIEGERARRSLSIARMLPEAEPLDRVLLLMTIHRSGSTRLFDLFRTHPATRIEPTMKVWRALGLTGRRYPVAFSDLPKSWRAIEVEYDVGATIAEIGAAPLPAEGARWALEKAHPQFADFDAQSFAERVAALRDAGTEVEVVYGVRVPLDAMWSMWSFQQRQPSWYAWIDTPDIPEWIERSLRSMAEMREVVPGSVIDYADLPTGDAVRQLAQRLAPAWDRPTLDAWADFAAAATSPDRPAQAGTGFLGGSQADRQDGGPDGSWDQASSALAEAKRLYDGLRA